MSDQPFSISETQDEQPPILGTWRNFYWLVVFLHFIIIALFSWLTFAYA